MEIIDTHLHIWDANKFDIPWLRSVENLLLKTYTLSDYCDALKNIDKCTIKKTVYVEVDVAPREKEKEANYIKKICEEKNSKITCAIISGDLLSDSFVSYIERVGHPIIKGVRQVLHTDEAPKGMCLNKQFINNINYLGEKGLLFEGCMRTEELNDLYLLAKQTPKTTIILNHMGNLDLGKLYANGKDLKNSVEYKKLWEKNIKNLASLPNVVCKISGFNSNNKKNIEEIVDFVFDNFAEERIVFASNFPVCNLGTSMEEWITNLDEITKKRGQIFQKNLFYKNAEKIYKLSGGNL